MQYGSRHRYEDDQWQPATGNITGTDCGNSGQNGQTGGATNVVATPKEELLYIIEMIRKLYDKNTEWVHEEENFQSEAKESFTCVQAEIRAANGRQAISNLMWVLYGDSADEINEVEVDSMCIHDLVVVI